MDPLDFLEIAKHLAASPRGAPAEAAFRSSTGRAYYAAFGFSRDVFKQCGFSFSGGHREHQDLIRLMKKSTISDVRAAGSALDDLREQRNSADYDVAGEHVRRGPFGQPQAGLASAQASTIAAAVRKAAKQDGRLGIP